MLLLSSLTSKGRHAAAFPAVRAPDRRVTCAARAAVEALEKRVLLSGTLPTAVHASSDAVYTISGDSTVGYAVTLSAGAYAFDANEGASGGDWQGLSLTLTGTADVSFNAPQTFTALTLAGTANAAVSSSGGGVSGNLLDVAAGGFSMPLDPATGKPTATLDLMDNDMILRGPASGSGDDELPVLRTLLHSGLPTGGTGLRSSDTTESGTSYVTRLGYRDGLSTFDGQATINGQAVKASDTLVKYTLNGDMDLDGRVTNADFARFSNSFGLSGTATWQTGDFNYDANTNNGDFGLLSNDFGQNITGPNFARTLLPVGLPVTAIEGQPLSGVNLDTFTDSLNTPANPTATTAASYQASVDWGDGNFVPASVTSPVAGQFVVSATSPYPLDNPNALIVAMIQYAPGSGLQGRPGTLGEPLLLRPAAPADLVATGASDTAVDLSWTNNSAIASGIEVDRSDGGSGYAKIATLATAASSYHDSGLAPGHHYSYQVAALQTGGLSALSNSADVYTADASFGLTATGGAGTIALAWTMAVAGTTALEVDRSTDGTHYAPVQTLPPGTTAYVDTGLADGTRYWYQVRALHADGTWQFAGPADAWSIAATPSDVLAVARGSKEVDLSWTGPSDPPAVYVIMRTSADGTTQVGQTAPGVFQFVDTTALPGVAYSYQVIAQGGGGVPSAASDPVPVSQLPEQPNLSSATAVSPREVDVTWTDGSGADSFVVERSLVGGTFAAVTTTGTAARSFADTSVADGTQYTYRVRAIQAGVESDVSVTQTATTPLATPSGLTATVPAGSSSEVDLAWVNNSATATGYYVERSTNDPSSFSTYFIVPDAATTEYVDHPDAGTRYYYRVLAMTRADSSDPSPTQDATTAPTVIISGEDFYTVDVQNPYVLSTAVIYDSAHLPDPVTGWTIHWGDGLMSGGAGPFTHPYARQGLFTITAEAQTAQGPVAANSFVVHVNVSTGPTLSVTAPESAAPRTPVSLSVDFENPVGATVTQWIVDWGDGHVERTAGPDEPSFTHTYAHAGVYFPISVTVFTSVGALTDPTGIRTTPNDAVDSPAPEVGFQVNQVFGAVEGSPATAVVEHCQMGGGGTSLTYTIDDWGDGQSSPSSTLPFNGEVAATHVYAEQGYYFVTATASDGSVARAWFRAGEEPWAGQMLAIPDQNVTVGQAVDVSTTFSGMDSDGPLMALVDWGDGNGPQPATITGSGGGGTVSAHLDHVTATLSSAASLTVYDEDGQAVHQTFWLTLPTGSSSLRLVVDSNNQDGLGDPTDGDTADREAIKNAPSLPGKVLPVDTGISGSVNYSFAGNVTVPDFAAGFGLNPADPREASGTTAAFTPVVIQLPLSSDWNWDNASLTIIYNASDPAAVTFTGTGTASDPYVYSLPSGDNPLRLWTAGSQSRSSQPFLSAYNAGPLSVSTGYYVAPGTYSGQALRTLFNNGSASTTLYLEGVSATQNTADRTISLNLSPGGGAGAQSDQALVTVGAAHLAIDSDNTSPPGDPQGTDSELPSRTTRQQQIQDDPTKPGKIIVVNDAVTDGSDIPRFADGYTTDTVTAAANPAEHFVPLVLQVPDAIDLSQVQITISYDASNPRFVQRPTAAEPAIGYAAAPGSLRIWTAAGNTLRNGNPVEGGGDFVTSGRSYDAAALGFTDSHRTVTFYVEAVRASSNPGDKQIQATLSVGPGGSLYNVVMPDAVRLTAVQDTAMAYGDPANVLLGDAGGSDGGDPASASFSGAVNLADGTASTPAVTDLSSGGFGQNWGVTRVWSGSLASRLNPGVVGNGWTISEMPSLLQGTSTVIANIDGRSALYFDLIPAASDSQPSYKARFYSLDALAYDAANDLYTLTDTTGGQLTFYGFGPSLATSQRGKLKVMSDPAGNPTTPHYNALGQLDTVTRTDGMVTETWTYVYATRDPNAPDAPDQLLSVALSRTGGTSSGPVRTVNYTYYPANDPNHHGNKGDLKTVKVDDAAGKLLSTYYYRYLISSGGPFSAPGRLTLVLGPVGYVRYMAQAGANIDTATDAQLQPYADFFLAYNSDGSVASQRIIGTGPTATDGNTSATYSYIYGTSADPAIDTNIWVHSTTESRPGISEQVYTNYAGEVMLSAEGTANPGQSWDTFTAYDALGRVSLQAMPSAVSAFDPALTDLLGKDTSGGYKFLRQTSGLIDRTTYGSSVIGGDAPGYVTETDLLHGSQGLTGNVITATANGTLVPVSTVQYLGHTSNNATIYVVASRTGYGAGDYGDARTTDYAYPNWVQLQPTEVVVTAPTTAEDSSGSPQSTTWFDLYGRMEWTQNALGYANYTGYDNATGAVALRIVDADPSNVPESASVPSDLSRPGSLPNALALTTTITVDNLGRPTDVNDPRGNDTRYSYVDTQNSSEMDTLPAAGPLQVAYSNFAKGFADSLTYSSAHLSTATSPHGGVLQSLTRATLDNAGRVVYSDRYYYDLSNGSYSVTSAFGAKDFNYSRTAYTYDAAGRQKTVTDDLNTVTETRYDGLGRVTSALVGGVTIQDNVYDAGGVGDGNLTRTTQEPGSDSLGKSLPNRITTNFYDWRDRLVASDNTVRLTYATLDNLGEVTQTDVYDRATAGFPAFAAPDGFASGNAAAPPNNNALRARTTTLYDDLGRAYKVTQDGVDSFDGSSPSTGVATVSSAIYYDAAGRVIATSNPTGLWSKTAYDGAGRPTAVYSTDGAGGGLAAASADHVFSQQEITYDGDSNTTLLVTRDRLQTDGTALGKLGDGAGSGGPAARVATVKSVYDSGNRLTETDNFGTNPVPSSGASGALVTKQVYDVAGRVQNTIDASGTWTLYQYDQLGRVIVRWDDYSSAAAANANSDLNKVTAYKYNGDDEVKTVSVNDFFPTVDGTHRTAEPQTTTYYYGTTGSLDQSKLSLVRYADGTTQAYLYDHLGEVVQKSDQDGTLHHYGFDALGRQTLDYVTPGANGGSAGVDFTVNALTTAYDVLDRPIRLNTDNGVPGSFNLVNQVSNVYDAFGNLSKQFQQGSIVVQYGYDPANPTRLQTMVYPDGRVEWYTYSGLDAAIGRVTSVNDQDANGNLGQAIEQYSYLGLATVVGKARPQIAAQTVTEAITPDTYGRVGAVQWSAPGSVGVSDSYTYAYDGVGDLTSAQNNVNPTASESYGYDNLHRQNSFRRGPLTAGVSDGTLVNESWQLDSQGNRYGDKYGSGYAGSDHKDANHNADGNQTTVTLDQGKVTLTYDAWGHVVSANSTQPQTDGEGITSDVTVLTHAYQYDALGREISDTSTTPGGTPAVNRLFYSGQNVIEERNGSSGAVSTQYVWSAAGPGALVLRDSQTTPSSPGTSQYIPQRPGAPLNQRLYAQDNGQGSVTSITGVGGGVQERYFYDQDGQPRAVQGSYAAWNDGSTNLQVDDSRFGWTYLWHGGRYTKFLPEGSGGTGGMVKGGGLYSFGSGGTLFDAYHGTGVQPDYSSYAMGTTPYDSGISNGWRYVATGATIGIGIAAGFLTGGLATLAIGAWGGAALGVTTAAGLELTTAGALTAGTLAGAGGGFAAGAAQGYGETGTLSGALKQGGIGAAAGAAGGFVGAGVGALAGSFAESAGLVCANGLGRVGGFVTGTAEGGAFGLTEGLVRGGITGGWEGAAREGGRGLLLGGIIGGTLGTVLGGACFAAGTELLVPDGKEGVDSKRIEEFADRDLIWTRSEFDPEAPLQVSYVQEVFVRMAKTLSMSLDGRLIRTTAEHPFFAAGRGWTKAASLAAGDRLIGHDGAISHVTEVRDTGEFETVYNLRIAECHTYFVALDACGSSVWAHNTSCDARELRQNLIDDLEVPQKYAAHLVPTGEWSARSATVQDAVAESQAILEDAGIELNDAENGFFSNRADHHGTHMDEYLLMLRDRLRPFDGDPAALVRELENIKVDALAGRFL